MNQLQERGAAVLDQVLDRSVVLGFSKIGYAVRRNLSTWPADPAPDALAGRDVVVTGASSGLGTAAAEGLARVGARVHLVVRDLEKGERARAELREAVPAASFELWRCDVSDLDDVRQLTKRLSGEVVSLGAVVHNAGAMPRERTESAQGHEMTMALHVLGPLVMTEGLLEPLAAGRGRVVLVTSGGMYGQRLPDDDPEYLEGEYKPATAYARSKRVQVGLLPELSQRWGHEGVDVHATHPGWADTPGVVESLPGFRRVTRPILRDAAQGADTTVWVSAAEPRPRSGTLWHDRRPRPDHLLPWIKDSNESRAAVWRWARDAAGLDA
jgi:NAD(P)-dependent dehydrogenase (short-subunit alcohol dehydrogenase family)